MSEECLHLEDAFHWKEQPKNGIRRSDHPMQHTNAPLHDFRGNKIEYINAYAVQALTTWSTHFRDNHVKSAIQFCVHFSSQKTSQKKQKTAKLR